MRSKLLITVAVLGACFFGSIAHADEILHFDDFTGGNNSVAAALSQLGESATGATHASFTTVLASQAWDLVIVDISSSLLSGANQTALAAHISGGGRVIMSYWSLNTAPGLAAAFEASVAGSFSSLPTLYDWSSGSHAIWNAPNAVGSPVSFLPEFLSDNGDYLDATGGATTVGGFIAWPTAGRGAIVVGNGGNTILNGWSFDEIAGVNGVNLVANEITFGLGHAAVPEPSSLALLSLGVVGMAYGARRRSRRRAR